MRTLAAIVPLLCAIATARADGTNATPTNATPTKTTGAVSQSLITELQKPPPAVTITPIEPKPNQITIGKTEATGILIEAAKTRPLWKLINPFSPPANSSVEDNVNRDITTGKVNGLKLFAITF